MTHDRFVYKVGGEEVALDRDDDFVAVRFRADSTRSERAAVARAASIRFADRIEVVSERIDALPGRIDLLSERMVVLPVPPTPDTRGTRRAAAEEAFKSSGVIERASPVFRVWGGHAIVAQRVVLALSDPERPPGWLTDGKPGRSLRDVAYSPKDSGEMDLVLGPDEDPLKVVESLSGNPHLRYVEPSFINLLGHQRAYQPGLRSARIIGGTGARAGDDPEYAMRAIKAQAARALQIGDDNVIIAILDEGVDTRHEDLPTPVAQFDATDGDTYQEPNAWDSHGTACAGLALALENDRGIIGVGAGCSMMAVRIARSNALGAPWVTTNEVCATGIRWAVLRNASILSLSWGGGAPSNRLIEAIRHAVTKGRNGLGCVVVAAAGNEDRRVNFPGTLPEVLTVGASNARDEPKTRWSSDGDPSWGSNHGPELDLVAPGVRLRTTDIMGQGGYDDHLDVTGNYYDDFSGTSGATPLVAGAAGLVLSANPTLRGAEVHQILRDTADQVGPLRYINGRNDRMGHGRLNVEKAVLEAVKRRTVV